ncbi:MAG TPA: TIGR03617 family F420-dependent LLM class oxidoreductase [Mycobacterium sp.]|nr:TIGR03617 family F420-dependent LLM class oxidoreductase [Mycobacterium sp.]
MKVYAAMDPQLPLAASPAYARRVEQLGFDGLHVAETIHDSLAVALLALEHTTRITVRTAVTLAFVRSPTLVAYTAWDLSVLSGGRFELGLGTQIKQNIEDRFGMPWTEPRGRMAEYLAAVGALFEAFRTGGPVRFEGDTYRVTRMQPYFNPGPSDAVAPPIWLGAVNAGMCELAGATAHGVVTHSTNSDPAYLRDVVRPALQRGAAGAGRTTRPLIAASAAIATGDSDDAVAQDRERQRRMLAFLYSTPSYATALKRRGWTDLPEQLRVLVRAQRWDDLPAVLGDAVLDELLICGRYDELPSALAARFGDIADGVVLPPLGAQDDDGSLRACIAELSRR